MFKCKVLHNQIKTNIMTFLRAHKDRSFTVRQLEENIGRSGSTIRKCLVELAMADMVESLYNGHNWRLKE